MTTLQIRERPIRPEQAPGLVPRSASPPDLAAATASADGAPILTWAELAECTCPEHCERDHGDE